MGSPVGLLFPVLRQDNKKLGKFLGEWNGETETKVKQPRDLQPDNKSAEQFIAR